MSKTIHKAMSRSALDVLMTAIDERIRPLGFECIEVEWDRHVQTLRVFVDSLVADDIQTISLEQCARVSEALTSDTTFEALVPEPDFQLEVSSPGIERPLRRPQHFSRFVGRKVEVAVDAQQGRALPQQISGEILAVSADDSVTIQTQTGPWTFSVNDVAKASLVYDWGRH